MYCDDTHRLRSGCGSRGGDWWGRRRCRWPCINNAAARAAAGLRACSSLRRCSRLFAASSSLRACPSGCPCSGIRAPSGLHGAAGVLLSMTVGALRESETSICQRGARAISLLLIRDMFALPQIRPRALYVMIGAALRCGRYFFENVTIALQFLERRPGTVFHRLRRQLRDRRTGGARLFYQVARGAARLTRVPPSSFRKCARQPGTEEWNAAYAGLRNS